MDISRRSRQAVESRSLGVLVALGDVLGADLQVRLYPTTGPRIHDRIQAAMIEALFAALHPGWKRIPEVAVHRPARGFIDAVLVLSSEGLFVATEGQSEIRRLEQQIRWGRSEAQIQGLAGRMLPHSHHTSGM
jgi:hypothetical protein